jgi:surfactin synthase thioesterase subunit
MNEVLEYQQKTKLSANLSADLLGKIMEISRNPKLRVKSALLEEYRVKTDNPVGCACLVVIGEIDAKIENLHKKISDCQSFTKNMAMLEEVQKNITTKYQVHNLLNGSNKILGTSQISKIK